MKLICKVITLISISLMLLFLSGCQAVFTTSLFKDVFKPDPSQIPPAQLPEYFQDVLINGTPTEKATAFTEIKTAIEKGNDNPELSYVAGELALDQLGLSIDNLVTFVSNPEQAQPLLTLDNLEVFTDMAGYLYTAYEGDVELTSSDKVFCGIGLILETVPVEDLATIDPNNLPAELVIPFNLINEGVAESALLQGIFDSLMSGGGV